MQSRQPSSISPTDQKHLLQLFQSQSLNKVITFPSFKKIYLTILPQKGINDQTLDTIFTSQKLKIQSINIQQFLSYVKFINRQLTYHTQDSHPFGIYVGNQLVQIVNKRLEIEKESEELPVYKVPKDLQEILHETNGEVGYTNDLLSDFQTKQLTYKKKSFTYRLWNYQQESKQKDQNPFRQKQTNKYSQLLRAAFGLQFKTILSTLKQMDQNDKELKVLRMVTKQFSQLQDLATSDRELNQFFKARGNFNPETFKVARKKVFFELSRNKAVFLVKWCASLSSTFKNNFLKAIMIYWGNQRDWSGEMFPEICFDENLPLVDRFFFAKWNFSQEMYAKFVEEIIKIGEKSSRLEYILLFGKRQKSAEILQNYYDLTLDIQTVALLSIYFTIGNFDGRTSQHSNIYQHFLKTYKQNLKLSNKKIVLQMFQKKQRQILAEKNTIDDRMLSIRCNNCGTDLSLCSSQEISKQKLMNETKKQSKEKDFSKYPVIKQCPVCAEYYHRCSTCLAPTEMRNPRFNALDNKEQYSHKNESTTIELGVLFCLKCKHGGHFFHIYEWFIHETVCPIPECECQCIL